MTDIDFLILLICAVAVVMIARTVISGVAVLRAARKENKEDRT